VRALDESPLLLKCLALVLHVHLQLAVQLTEPPQLRLEHLALAHLRRVQRRPSALCILERRRRLLAVDRARCDRRNDRSLVASKHQRV
jgi:hypothetical protein